MLKLLPPCSLHIHLYVLHYKIITYFPIKSSADTKKSAEFHKNITLHKRRRNVIYNTHIIFRRQCLFQRIISVKVVSYDIFKIFSLYNHPALAAAYHNNSGLGDTVVV